MKATFQGLVPLYFWPPLNCFLGASCLYPPVYIHVLARVITSTVRWRYKVVGNRVYHVKPCQTNCVNYKHTSYYYTSPWPNCQGTVIAHNEDQLYPSYWGYYFLDSYKRKDYKNPKLTGFRMISLSCPSYRSFLRYHPRGDSKNYGTPSPSPSPVGLYAPCVQPNYCAGGTSIGLQHCL